MRLLNYIKVLKNKSQLFLEYLEVYDNNQLIYVTKHRLLLS